MAESLRSESQQRVSVAIQRLVGEAAESDKAGKVSRVAFDPGQSKMAWPAHWPKDAIFPPGGYCTDRYLLVDFLGRGGIAEVYEARDMLEDAFVALKVVRSTKASPEILGKVAAEARTLKVVEHPNVLRVFDAGFVETDELLFFSMERLLGSTLHDLIYRSRGARSAPRVPALPLVQAARIAIGIARGVNALHKQRIFHRDIKPENLFYTREGELKVFDLDVAKFNAMCNLRTTKPGYTMGTVLYMSPELLQEGTTNERSDIYAIGLVLFEMVAGHHAFASNPDEVLAQADVIAWHAARLPPRLSKMIAGVPIGVDAVIRKCVEKNPAKRFRTCEELLEALIPLEQLLAKAEAAKAPGPAPDLVVRVESAPPPPRFAHATTDRAATAVPSTPYPIVPPPLFDEPAVRADMPALVPAAVSPGALRGPDVAPHLPEAAVHPATQRSGVPRAGRVEAMAIASESGGRANGEPAVAPGTSGVRAIEEDAAVSGDAVPAGHPEVAVVQSGVPRSAVPASLERGPRGTEVIATGRSDFAPVTPGGTARMLPVASPRSAVESARPPAGPMPDASWPSAARMREGDASKPSGAPIREGDARTAAAVRERASHGPDRTQLLVYGACVLAGVLLASIVWAVAIRTARLEAESATAAPAATARATATPAATMTSAPAATSAITTTREPTLPSATVTTSSDATAAPATSSRPPALSVTKPRAPKEKPKPTAPQGTPVTRPSAPAPTVVNPWPNE